MAIVLRCAWHHVAQDSFVAQPNAPAGDTDPHWGGASGGAAPARSTETGPSPQVEPDAPAGATDPHWEAAPGGAGSARDARSGYAVQDQFVHNLHNFSLVFVAGAHRA